MKKVGIISIAWFFINSCSLLLNETFYNVKGTFRKVEVERGGRYSPKRVWLYLDNWDHKFGVHNSFAKYSTIQKLKKLNVGDTLYLTVGNLFGRRKTGNSTICYSLISSKGTLFTINKEIQIHDSISFLFRLQLMFQSICIQLEYSFYSH